VQFIIHRGLIISFIQAVFSAIFFMAAVAVYTGWLLVGYSTWYTMAPVFALVLDEDVKKADAFTFPELYKELQKGRALNIKTFFQWTLLSVYQASVIMVLSILLFESRLLNIVSITFTALILSELINVAFTICTWSLLIVLAEIVTFALYFVSMLLLPAYFGTCCLAWLSFDALWTHCCARGRPAIHLDVRLLVARRGRDDGELRAGLSHQDHPPQAQPTDVDQVANVVSRSRSHSLTRTMVDAADSRPHHLSDAALYYNNIISARR